MSQNDRFDYSFDYPMSFIHEGTMLGNGFLGLYVWGSGNTLNITVGCASLWDHRGGMSWTAKQNYAAIRKALAEGDEAAIREIFACDSSAAADVASGPKVPARPSIIPVGRIAVALPDGWRLRRNCLDLRAGKVTVWAATAGKEAAVVAELLLDMAEKGLFMVKLLVEAQAEVLPAYDLCDGALAERGFLPPKRLGDSAATAGLHGFLQEMPADAAYGLALQKQGDGEVRCLFWRGGDGECPRELLDCGGSDGWERLVQSNADWWARYWSVCPEVATGNDELDALYRLSLFKFGAMTAADGVPAGLQGPWIEDDRLPPWSGDYDFNINVEMCYWPAYRANHPENLRPVFDLVLSWRPQLRQNAKHYVGIDDGYMLPHAVDDRCVCMGAFWTGAIDHACSAWMAQMMFDYVDFTGDVEFLRQEVYDFMKGTMNVFLATLERQPDGTLWLPLSVSPEYRGAQMNAWGANASFQLAAFHRLARNLVAAAGLLGEEPAPQWLEVIGKLPLAALVKNEAGREEIGLWDGLLLEESHRHHSHLAALCPFDVIDPGEPAWQAVVSASIDRWVKLGRGMWTGWCVPWAAMLECRLGNPDAAEFLLEEWRHLYTYKNGGSSHDAVFPGACSAYGWCKGVMQMDATMGALTAIQDMLMHSRQGVLHLFAGISPRHEEAAFGWMAAPGGFQVKACRNRECSLVAIRARRDGEVTVVFHGLDGQAYQKRLKLSAGEELTWRI